MPEMQFASTPPSKRLKLPPAFVAPAVASESASRAANSKGDDIPSEANQTGEVDGQCEATAQGVLGKAVEAGNVSKETEEEEELPDGAGDGMEGLKDLALACP